MAGALAPQTFAGLKAELDARAGGRIVGVGSRAISSGLGDLDRALAGGFIRGSIATVEGPPSSGRTSLLATTLSCATRTGLAAAIDQGALYPPHLERAGVTLERLFIVSAQSSIAAARCADVLLRSAAFVVVVMPAVQLRAALWSRLAALAQKSGALLLTYGVRAGNELGFFASTRLHCAIDCVRWSANGCLRELQGYELRASVLKHRRSC